LNIFKRISQIIFRLEPFLSIDYFLIWLKHIINVFPFFNLKLSKKYITVISIIISAFVIYGIYNLSHYIKKVKIYEPVSITVDGLNDNDFNTVNIYGISPKNRILNLNKLIELHKWNYNYYRYYTAIKLSVPDSIIDKIKQISITIGKTNYIYDNAKFKHEWNKIKEESKTNMGYSIYELPENARGNASVISVLASILYWNGYHVKVILLISLVVIILLFFKYIKSQKSTLYISLNKTIESVADFFYNNRLIFFILCIILLIPALLINIGLIPFCGDESKRALIALEMITSGNYVIPTLNGLYNYSKPPLYNWILVLFLKLTGNNTEFILRLPNVISLLLFGLTVFLFIRKHYGNKIAFINAFILITGEQILFWDSYQGLIDMCLSWVTFTGFIAIYYFYQKGKFYWLFAISYFITGVGFMLKGLPSIVFQGITLFVIFAYHKNFKKLFSIQHILGILIFILMIGTYLYFFNHYISVKPYLLTLWLELTEKNMTSYGLWKTVLHFFKYPFQVLLSVFPWTLLLISCFKKKFFKEIMQNPLLKFSFLIFASNILVYLLSPRTNFRYFFALYPLMIIILTHFYFKYQSKNNFLHNITDIAFLIWLVIIALKSNILLLIIFVFIIFLFIEIKKCRLILIIITLLILRIDFNLFKSPNNIDSKLIKYKEAGIKIAQITKGKLVFLYSGTETNDIIPFYYTRESKKILTTYQNGDIKENKMFVNKLILSDNKDVSDYRISKKAKTLEDLILLVKQDSSIYTKEEKKFFSDYLKFIITYDNKNSNCATQKIIKLWETELKNYPDNIFYIINDLYLQRIKKQGFIYTNYYDFETDDKDYYITHISKEKQLLYKHLHLIKFKKK